jgi:ureidoacrylate peracid hydrolase
MNAAEHSWLEPKRTALIVVDLQNDYCAEAGHLARNGQDVSAIGAILPRVVRLAAGARQAGALVIFTQQTSYPGGIGRSAARAHYKAKAKPGLGTDYPLAGSWGHAVAAPLEPQAEDLLLPKCRQSAFFGTPLDTILRAAERDIILFCGAVTEGCVETSVRDAANHDYIPVVIEDCVASNRPELHAAAMTVMRARYDTIGADALLARWSMPAGIGR